MRRTVSNGFCSQVEQLSALCNICIQHISSRSAHPTQPLLLLPAKQDRQHVRQAEFRPVRLDKVQLGVLARLRERSEPHH